MTTPTPTPQPDPLPNGGVDLAGRCLRCGEHVQSSAGCDCRFINLTENSMTTNQSTPQPDAGARPTHSPLPWRASPTGQLYDANNNPLIGVGAFNSRWDAAAVRDAMNATPSPVASPDSGKADELFKASERFYDWLMDMKNWPVKDIPDGIFSPWNDALRAYSNRPLLAATPHEGSGDGDAKYTERLFWLEGIIERGRGTVELGITEDGNVGIWLRGADKSSGSGVDLCQAIDSAMAAMHSAQPGKGEDGK